MHKTVRDFEIVKCRSPNILGNFCLSLNSLLVRVDESHLSVLDKSLKANCRYKARICYRLMRGFNVLIALCPFIV